MSRYSRVKQRTANVRALMAIIVGSAAVAIGAVAVTVAQNAPAPAASGSSGASGATITTTIPPSTPEVAFASPTVTATFFGKH